MGRGRSGRRQKPRLSCQPPSHDYDGLGRRLWELDLDCARDEIFDPRKVNRIAHYALTAAAIDNQQQVNDEHLFNAIEALRP